MEKFCPITDRYIDENAARLNAVLVILLYALFFYTQHWLIALFIFSDFLIRGFLNPRYSLLSASSKMFLKLVPIKAKIQNAGPKIFAAQIGTFLSGAVFICSVSGYSSVGCYIGAVLVFFAFLESAFAFCVACKMYPYFVKLVRTRE
jgi:hypothetical protein